MKTGTVKFFNDEKGFGFIVDDETQQDVFVHVSGTVDAITQEGRKGINAVNVRKI